LEKNSSSSNTIYNWTHDGFAAFCFGIIAIKVNVVELLIPITILITALFNLFTAGKSVKEYKFGFITLFLE
jgi:hypothetical protein